jgi:hypothetical protein
MKMVVRAAMTAAAMFVLAQGALASTPGGDCEVDDSCGNPSPPTLDSLSYPPITQAGLFFAYPSNGRDGQVVQGSSYYNTRAGEWYISRNGGGVGDPLGSDVHTYGNDNSFASIQSFFSPTPTASVVAHQDVYSGRTYATMSLVYLVTLSTPDAATAAAVQRVLDQGPLATVHGEYKLTASGYANSSASAASGFGPDGDDSYGTASQCNDSDRLGGCGDRSFDINLGFRPGTDFTDGQPTDFYAEIYLTADADAGLGGTTPFFGDASAFIDPTINLSSKLNGLSLTLSQGSYGPHGLYTPPPASAAPEPASWALMLGGFGLVGGALRRRKAGTLARA